jgi:hypothetical protein
MAIPATLSSVPEQTPYIQYVATAGQTVFPYPFVITQDSDLAVLYNGTLLSTDQGYTLSGQGNSTGGNVTFATGASAGDIVTLYRDIPIERLTQIGQNSGFSSTAFNAEFNNLYLIAQQLQEATNLCLQVPNTNIGPPVTTLTPANYANKLLGFDSNGNPTPALLTSSTPLTASIIGQALYQQSLAEFNAGITPVNYQYPPGNILRYGADPTGVADSKTAILNAGACAGQGVFFPAGTYSVSGTLAYSTNQYWVCNSRAVINYAAASGSAAAPLCNFVATVNMRGPFVFNHNANSLAMTNPTIYNANYIAGACIMVQGNDSTIDGIEVLNAWDDGIALVNLNSSGVAQAGLPKFCTVSNVQTTNCGVGAHTGAVTGKNGAGLDIASASGCTVVNHIDYSSYCGFILDVGAGANGNFSNVTSWYALQDSANPTNGSGYAFYIGAGDSNFTNFAAFGPAYRGFWIDANAFNTNLTNCYVFYPQYEGFYIKAGQVSLTNCRVKGASAVSSGSYDAMLIDCSAGNIGELLIVNFAATGGTQRYGINVEGSNVVTGMVLGGDITGETAPTNFGSNPIGLLYWSEAGGIKWGVNRNAPGVAWDIYGGLRSTASAANTSYLVNAFGDTGSNGNFFVEDFATNGKRLGGGYDPVNDVFVLQAIQAGVGKKSLMLNPSGGSVGLGGNNGALSTSSTNGFPMIPTCPGTPTGTPSPAPSGFAPMVFDTSANKIWVYNGSAWKGVAVS